MSKRYLLMLDFLVVFNFLPKQGRSLEALMKKVYLKIKKKYNSQCITVVVKCYWSKISIKQKKEEKCLNFYIYKWKIELILQQIKKKEGMSLKILKKGETPDLQHTELYDKVTKLEADILEKIQKCKRENRSYICEHFSIEKDTCEEYNPVINYYDKFWKRFLLNEIGKQNLLKFREEVMKLTNRVSRIETMFDQWDTFVEPIYKNKNKKKKSRQEEQQRYLCITCGRSYKDEDTLTLHHKIKHRQPQKINQQRHQTRKQDIFEEEHQAK